MFHIYGRPYCSWCQAAKDLLDDMNINYDYHELNYSNLSGFIKIFGDVKSVPQIAYKDYADGPFIPIGGYEDLVKFLR